MRSVTLPIASLIALVAPALLGAQPLSAEAPREALTAGPYFACGPSLHLGAPEGETAGSRFAFRLGASIRFPLTGHLTGTLDIGSDSRGIERRAAGNDNNNTVTRVGYFTFTPGFAISSFWFGLNLGIPLAASTTRTIGSTHRAEALSDAAFAGIEYMVEPRIGATVKVFEDTGGWLGATLGAGVTLNAISLGAGDAGDYRIFSGHIGLTYQFVLPEP